MKGLRNLLLILLMGFGIFYLFQDDILPKETISTNTPAFGEKETQLVSKTTPGHSNPITGLSGELYDWIGKNSNKLEQDLGKPIRIDPSSYGYDWWVYTDRVNQYIQFGINHNNKIVTIYATGNDLPTEPIAIGQPYNKVNEKFNFTDEVSFSKGIATYRFHLTPEDIKSRPLTQIDDDKFVQFYFDTFTEQLSSIRILSTDVLLLHRPYEIFYRGDVPTTPIMTDQEWVKVDQGMEKQIFDITNIIRARYEKSTLTWDDQVAKVALGHSKDMQQNNYFSHYTLAGDGLKERLSTISLFYLSAGENIAAQYTDAPAVVEGWINSEGHRKALLEENYTHLGVGVYRYYYTQNFLEKPSS